VATKRENRAEALLLIYLGMGEDRTLIRVVETAGAMGVSRVPSKTTVERYSVDFNWVDRAADYDDEQLNGLRGATLQQAIVNDIEHARFGRSMRRLVEDKGMKALEGFDEWTPMHAARMGAEAIKIERIASGQATERREIMLPFVNMLTGELAEAFIRAMDECGAPDTMRALALDSYASSVDHIIETHFVRVGIEAEVDDVEDDEEAARD
jgi:hypothetical protein